MFQREKSENSTTSVSISECLPLNSTMRNFLRDRNSSDPLRLEAAVWIQGRCVFAFASRLLPVSCFPVAKIEEQRAANCGGRNRTKSRVSWEEGQLFLFRVEGYRWGWPYFASLMNLSDSLLLVPHRFFRDDFFFRLIELNLSVW